MKAARALKRKSKPKIIHKTGYDYQTLSDTAQIATENALTFVFLALRDKFGFGGQRLSRLLDAYNEIAKAANEGYVKPQDVRKALYEECKDLRDTFVERK